MTKKTLKRIIEQQDALIVVLSKERAELRARLEHLENADREPTFEENVALGQLFVEAAALEPGEGRVCPLPPSAFVAPPIKH